ncbi:MAG: PQQ-binding-like beta-propeller repeat protein [Mariprofundaceae bacterium]|nr:PQQ-binding-like beta-propeller repeat protein [Mariprofundaceae bacterium]
MSIFLRKNKYFMAACLLSQMLFSGAAIASDLPTSLASLQIVWSTDVDGRKPADKLSFSAPVVTGQGQHARIVIGGADARIHVYDMSGKETYRLPIQQNSDSGAAVLASGLVVLGDSQGKLYAVNAQQGKVVWQLALSSSMTGSPIAVDDDVVVQTTGNNLYRINQQGEKVWSFSSQQGGLSLYLSSSPMLHDGKIYALLSNGDAVAMDAKTGDLLWRKQLLLDTDASMLSQLKAPLTTPLWLSHVSFDGRVLHDVVLFSFYHGKIFALSVDDGQTMLAQDISLKSSPVLWNDILYMVDTDGVLQALNSHDGQQQWKKALPHHEWVGPVVWHDALWLASEKGLVLKVSLTGELLAVLDIQGNIERAPLITSDGLLIHNTLGGLYLIHE